MPPESAAWRCFIGVPLTDELRAPLAAAVSRWRRELDARWTDPIGWHVSLLFIGAVEPDRVDELDRSLAAAFADGVGFVVRTGGLGALPDERRARVIFHRVEDPTRGLAMLAAAAARAVTGAQPGAGRRAFLPHVTLARLRRPQRVDEWLARRRTETPSATLAVTEARLVRSHLGDGPARYETLARYGLRAPATVTV